MFSQIGKNLWVTKIFFLVRFAAALVVSIVYIILAAGIQNMFVKWFGENTFNYILGGLMSLALGALVCNYLGRLLFMFVRGWHMAALAYARKIQAKHLPALDAGMKVFSKHFTSFAVVYGASTLLGRFAENGAEKLWDMFEDVPYLGSFAKIANNPVTRHIARDLLDTGFDAVIFYIVRYTKPGLEGDLEAVPKALRKYLYALPSIMGASLGSYLLLYIAPLILRVVIIISAFLSQGFLGGILITVLLYPVFFILKHVLFDPLETIILMSAYAKHCTEEEPEDNIYSSLVDTILESIGLSDVGDVEEEDIEEEATEKPKTTKAPKSTQAVPQENEVLDVEPEFDISDFPESGDEDTQPRFAAGSTAADRLRNLSQQLHESSPDVPRGGLADLARQMPHIPSIEDDEEEVPRGSLASMLGSMPVIPTLDEEEEDSGVEQLAPVAKLTELLNGMDASAFDAELGSDEDTGVLGGDDIDFS